ncbi:Rieske 2Fe-2S domain-containing protein [Mesorhizobium sp. ORM8.1]
MSEGRDHRKDVWQAVALSADIGKRPKRILFDGQPVVLFRSAQGIAALFDRCPHRLVELSTGKIVGGEIECPYHGWRYDSGGVAPPFPAMSATCRITASAIMPRSGATASSSSPPARRRANPICTACRTRKSSCGGCAHRRSRR